MRSNLHFSHSQSAPEIQSAFCAKVVGEVAAVKQRLHQRLSAAHPGQAHLVARALVEAEELAWETSFPHLLFPDFAEVRLAGIVSERERLPIAAAA